MGRVDGNGTSARRTGPLMTPHPASLDLPAKYGGDSVFDMYALTYVSESDPALLCPICHDPLVDPVTTPCDHTFCYRCLRRSIESSPAGTACPVDREPLTWAECFSTGRLVRAQLNGLVVKCPHHGRGCTNECKRENIETHATVECRFKDYHCADPECDKKVRSKPVVDYCQHYSTHCRYCDQAIIEADRDLHLLTCEKGKARCEACWQMVTRASMTSHHELDCDGIEVGCQYADLGCPVRVERGDLAEHLSECPFHPETASGMVIRSQRDLIQTYADLTSQVQQCRSQQAENARKIEDITLAVDGRGRSDSSLGDHRTMQDLDAGFEEVHQNLTHLEARQSMWTMNQVMPIREEVTELRNNINMIRMHVNWLLNRSREEGRIRAAHNSGAGGIHRENSADGVSMPTMPERRRSSGTDTDLPRL